MSKPTPLLANMGALILRCCAPLFCLLFLFVLSDNAAAQASLRLLTPGGTTFTGPSGFDLKIEALPGATGNVYEEIEFYWLERNGVRIDFEDAPTVRIYTESELPPGVYQYALQGRALYHDPRTGNEKYRTILPIPRVTITVIHPTGGIYASAATCTIPWGQPSCGTTISWSSNAPAAQVWMSGLDNSGMQLIGQAQSGSATAWLTGSGARFHLRNGSATIATTEARGIPTVNQAPTVSVAAPVQGALFAAGASIPISAAAGDGDDGLSRVEFRVDGTTLATLSSPPYSTRVTTLSPGTHSLVAIATDTRGTSTTSAAVTFSVSSIPGTSLSRKYVYDAQQRLCKTIEPETGSTVMAYDQAGNLIWSAAGLDLPSTTSCDLVAAEASGRVVRRTYDARSRIATLRFPDHNGDVDYSYTPDGLVLQTTAYNDGGTTTATTTYQYNKRRLLTGEALAQTGATTRSIGYGYSPNGHLAGQTYPSGRFIDYAPNAMGQATRAGDYATGVSYYPNGGIKQFTYGNGILHTTLQNARRLPSRSVDSNIIAFETTFDANGNVTAIADLQLGTSYSRQMQYDNRDRLIAAGSQMFGGDGWHRFTYDALDNMRSWSLGSVKADQYWYDARNRLTNIRNGDGATTVGLSYDLQGNLGAKNGQASRFDYGNRLREVPGKATYRYDAKGLRTLDINPNGAFEESLYSKDGQLVSQFDWSNGMLTETVFLAGSTIAQLETSSSVTATKYLHTHALGSPVASSNLSGQLIERTHFEPYGTPINRNVDGIGYSGHKMDANTSLTYMQQRYYDPQLGLFLSVDPVSAYASQKHFNRYNYAYSNPYSFSDPDGRNPLVPFIYGAVAGGLADIAVQKLMNPDKPIDKVEVGVAAVVGSFSGGTGGLLVSAVSSGTISVGRAVIIQTVVNAFAGGAGSVTENAIKGQPITAEGVTTNALGSAAGGLAGSGVGAAMGDFAGPAARGTLQRLSQSSAPGAPNIARATASTGIAIPRQSATQGAISQLGQNAAGAGVTIVQKNEETK